VEGGGGSPEAHFSFADGATKIDIRSALRVTFTEALDPSSVTTDHVHLDSTGFTVPVTFSYDSTTSTITVTPVAALHHDTGYVLTVDGLRASSGNEVPAAASHFTTWVNSQFDVLLHGQAANSGATHWVTTLDADGHPAQMVGTDALGNVKDCTTYIYAGGIAQSSTQSDPGPDGKCLTADDDPQETLRNVHDANGALVAIDHFNGAGTGPAFGRESFAYDALGDTASDLFYLAGPDGQVGTGDDQLSDGWVSTYDGQGLLLHTVYNGSGGAGPDGVLFTNDDIDQVRVFTPGTGGAPDVLISYDDPGPDGRWLTSDDIADGYTKDWHDARGNVVQSISGSYFQGVPQDLHCTLSTYDEHDNLVVVNEVALSGNQGCNDHIDLTTTYDTSH
jgi:hypothetical protein